MLHSFGNGIRAAVIGANGGIGQAFVKALQSSGNIEHIYAFSRNPVAQSNTKTSYLPIDITSEKSIEQAAQITQDKPLDLIIVTIGVLHDGADFQPEKGLKDLKADSFEKAFAVNAIGPAMIAKHFTPLLPRDKKSCFMALSAKVSSISENDLGGWYAYRASKAALNMIIKNVSIETARRCKQAVVITMHPGSVHTPLSDPFHKGMDPQKIMGADQSVQHMLQVIDTLDASHSGRMFAFDGSEIRY